MPNLTIDRSRLDSADQQVQEATALYLLSAVAWEWPGTSRSIKGSLRQQISLTLDADTGSVTAGTRLYDWTHPALSRIAALKREVTANWQRQTAPWTEPGRRLMKKDDVSAFEGTMADYRSTLANQIEAVQFARDEILLAARARRGKAFSLADYPADLSSLFGLSWSFSTLTVPEELRHLSATAYAAEQARNATRIMGALRLGEEAFTRELSSIVTHLIARLAVLDAPREPDSRAPRFCASAVSALSEFTQRFSAVVCWGCDDLRDLVESAGNTVAGLTADDLRQDEGARAQLAADLRAVSDRLSSMLPPEAPADATD